MARNQVDADLLHIRNAEKRPTRILVERALDEFVKGTNDLWGFPGKHVEKATPNIRARKCAHLKMCHDAEIVATAFESAPEVGVMFLGSSYDGTRSQDDTVFEDIVANESTARAKVGVAACSVVSDKCF